MANLSQPVFRGSAVTGEVFKGTGRKLKNTPRGKQHSPLGFGWGYGGSGPSALAHSILSEMYGPRIADEHYQNFKAEVIAGLPLNDDFSLSYSAVNQWAAKAGILDPETNELYTRRGNPRKGAKSGADGLEGDFEIDRIE